MSGRDPGLIGPIKRFGRYTLVKKIATGGMAEIWLARQRGLADFKRFVVIKKILDHLSTQKQFEARFLDEARTSALLNHPNIVQVYDLGEEQGSLFIAMEYIRGENLAAVSWRGAQKGQPLLPDYAARIIADSCRALHYAHQLRSASGEPLSIVHRDISPQNILLTYEGDVKVVDFGIAKAASQTEETKTGMLLGKFSYMSPEQVEGRAIDRRSDVFALGILLYELATCRRLFKHESELMIIDMIARRPVAPPSDVIPGFSPELEEVIMRALEKDPARRFQSALQMQLALEDYLRQHPVSSTQVGSLIQSLFSDSMQEKRQILHAASRDDLDQLAEPRRVVVHGASPSQMRATGSPGPFYPPHATGSPGPFYPPHATGSPGSFYPPHAAGTPLTFAPYSVAPPHATGTPALTVPTNPWVGRMVIVAALVVIFVAGFVLLSHLLNDVPVQYVEQKQYGKLSVESRPSGADIILNGTPMKLDSGAVAVTPGEISRLPYGAQEITLKKAGYQPKTVPLTMSESTDGTTVQRVLKPFDSAVRVEVETRQQAKIFFDGELAGIGPVLKKTLPGFRTIGVSARYRHLTCTSSPESITLQPNAATIVVVTCIEQKQRKKQRKKRRKQPPEEERCVEMPRDPGRLHIGSQPYAEVFYKGRSLGTTPMANIRLPSGCVVLTFVTPDGRKIRREIEVPPGRVSTLKVDL